MTKQKSTVDTHYVMQGDAEMNHWEARLGPFDFKSQAVNALLEIRANFFLPNKRTMNGIEAAKCDPEGVAELKRKSKKP